MVAARMMVPLRGDLATRLAPQRFWFGMADRNAHNRPEPGIKFYIHVSDRFVTFWAKLRGLHGYGLP